jgi:hypothetical protein
LFHSWNFCHAREYFWGTHALAPFSLTLMSFDTTLTLVTLHPNQMATSRFSSKTKIQIRTSNFLLIPLSWCSNTCHIYQQVVLRTWFLNTFGTIFTLKIQQVDSVNCSYFVFILHKATFHPKLHLSLERPAS